MAIYEVKTKGGSEYSIYTEAGYWSRNGSYLNRICIFKLAAHPMLLPWSDPGAKEWTDAEIPQVGMKMYLASMDTWAISSVVVSVDEKP